MLKIEKSPKCQGVKVPGSRGSPVS